MSQLRALVELFREELRAAAGLALVVIAVGAAYSLIASALHTALEGRRAHEAANAPVDEDTLRRSMDQEDERAVRRLFGTSCRVGLAPPGATAQRLSCIERYAP